MTARTIMLSIDCDSDVAFVKAFEITGRISAGLIVDGIECRLSSYLTEEEPS